MQKPILTAALATLVLATPAQATEEPVIAEDKVLVLGCLEQMENGTSWPECVALMFQPCVAETPGTDPHVICLNGIREEWSTTVQTLQSEVLEGVTSKGRSDILDLMGQWTSYVVQKCTEVAAAKPTGAESARLGCEVSELAGLSGEFAACLEGRSSADYCEFKE